MFIRFSFVALVFALFSCTPAKVTETASANDTVIAYAQHLQIFYEDSVVRIHILRGEENTSFKLILSDQPIKQIPKGYIFLQTPVKQIAALSSTQIGMLDKLESISSIRAVSNKKYIYNPTLLQRIKSGKVTSLGDEGIIPAESIIHSGSKHVIYSDFGQDFPQRKQLAALGIACIPNPDWRETHPLGKAEWIKFFGYLTGKKEKANQVFEETVKAYNELLKKTANVKQKPKVTSGNMIGDIWYAPAGSSYNALMIKHAGANYIYKHTTGTGSTERTAEQVIQENKQTQIWINPGFKTKQEILTNFPKLKHLPLLKGEQIYCYSAELNKFWELGATEPQHVLEDLIRIFHPELLPTGKMYFYTVVH